MSGWAQKFCCYQLQETVPLTPWPGALPLDSPRPHCTPHFHSSNISGTICEISCAHLHYTVNSWPGRVDVWPLVKLLIFCVIVCECTESCTCDWVVSGNVDLRCVDVGCLSIYLSITESSLIAASHCTVVFCWSYAAERCVIVTVHWW